MAETSPVISPSAFFTKTIGVGASSTDFHRGYLFQVILQKIEGFADPSLITYFVSATASPTETSGTITVPWMNSEIKIAGQTKYAEWTVTVRDDANSVAYNYFKMWRRLVYKTATGQSNVPKNYKYSVDLYLLNNCGEPGDRGYQLVNAWPTVIGSMTLDYATEAIITFPITIQYDEFIPLPK